MVNQEHRQGLIRTAAIAAVAAALVSLIFLALTTTQQSTTTHVGQYQRIQSSGVLRAAYAVGAPLFMIDPNSKQKSGLFYDLTNVAASKLGLTVQWTDEVGYGEMIAGLKANKYDIVGSGIWMNASRGKDADFSIPVYYDAVFAYVSEGDTRFDSAIAALNDPKYTISTMDGELGAAIAATDFPRARTLALPQNADFSQLILNVINHKADLVLLSSAAARQYQIANPGKLRQVPTKNPIRLFPVTLLLPKGSYELKQALDASLTEMLNNGELEKLLVNYEKAPNSFIRVHPPIEQSYTR